MSYVPPFVQSDADRFYDALIKDKDATIAGLSDDRRELLMAIENAARMAEQGILSADGGQCAGEIRALVPARFRAAQEVLP